MVLAALKEKGCSIHPEPAFTKEEWKLAWKTGVLDFSNGQKNTKLMSAFIFDKMRFKPAEK